MKAAAIHYARNVGGWSDEIGLYVNIFGHNNVNSLFVHVVDMSELGPGFGFQSFKNCPLDAVLKVLREEAASERSMLRSAPSPLAGTRSSSWRKTTSSPFFFAGTDGATSVKAGAPPLRDSGIWLGCVWGACPLQGARRAVVKCRLLVLGHFGESGLGSCRSTHGWVALSVCFVHVYMYIAMCMSMSMSTYMHMYMYTYVSECAGFLCLKSVRLWSRGWNGLSTSPFEAHCGI